MSSILVRSERTISTNIEAAPGVDVARHLPRVCPAPARLGQGLLGGVSGLREVLQDEFSGHLLLLLLLRARLDTLSI